eukprot:13128915-Alexandrium_andersonii.AAC.1
MREPWAQAGMLRHRAEPDRTRLPHLLESARPRVERQPHQRQPGAHADGPSPQNKLRSETLS